VAKKGDVVRTAFNEYTIVARIGEGGAGVVYKVKDSDGQEFALKTIDPTKSTKDKRKRFKNEIWFCQKMKHPRIVPVVDTGATREGYSFYVMPLYPSNLEEALTRGLLLDDMLNIFGQILDGVEVAHLSSVVHRDLKPANIVGDADKKSFVVADFGIASFEEEDIITAVETKQADRLANFQYAAPEQRERGLQVTKKADVYALGLILNRMFTGRIPVGTNYRTIGSVAAEHGYLDDLVSSMLRQDPEARPSIDGVKKELIARKALVLSTQKIDRLSGAVVSEGTIDDPLVVDPPRIVDVDYGPELLTFRLSAQPNGKWIEAFRNQGNFTSFMRRGPSTARVAADYVQINTAENEVEQQVVYFKQWLENANRIYKEQVQKEAILERERKEAEIRRNLADEERRKRVLEKLRGTY
jgi:serine/threonine protein kinase